MIDIESITEEEKTTCIQRALANHNDGRVRCLRCREILDLNQDCPRCGRSWDSWLRMWVWILREERKKEEDQRKEEEKMRAIAEGDTTLMYFDFDPGEVDF